MKHWFSPIGAKKGSSRYGAEQSKGQRAGGHNADTWGTAEGRDEFGKRKIKPSVKRKLPMTGQNNESAATTGRQWGMPGK
jgi:hypothetical protein